MIKAEHWDAYLNTVFDVSGEILFKQYAIITAWNPFSDLMSYQQNRANNVRLEADLHHYSYCRVLAGDPQFQWSEESFAVDIDLPDAISLGKKYRQNAIFYVSDGDLYLYSCIDAQSCYMGTIDERIIKSFNENHGGIMKDITPIICDKYESEIQILDLPLHNFGYRDVFCGQVVTVSCFKDSAKVIEQLSQDGKGKVLFVDGNGSCDVALFDDKTAALAVKNGWEGVIIYGALREAGALADRDIGIKALAACPRKSANHDTGHINVTLRIANQSIQPGDYLYSDWNGIVLSEKSLDF